MKKTNENQQGITIPTRLSKMIDSADDVEVYVSEKSMTSVDFIHTDSIQSLDVDPRSINPDLIQDYDYVSEEEYNRTVLANSCTPADYYEWYGKKDAKVLIIVVKRED